MKLAIIASLLSAASAFTPAPTGGMYDMTLYLFSFLLELFGGVRNVKISVWIYF